MPHLIPKQDRELWRIKEKARVVHRHYTMYHECGVRFIGDDIFPCTPEEMLNVWSIPEVKRVYDMISAYEVDEHRQH